MKIPEILNINATIPIIVHGSNRDIFSNANVIPTANAAILLIEHKTTKMHSIMQMHQYLLQQPAKSIP